LFFKRGQVLAFLATAGDTGGGTVGQVKVESGREFQGFEIGSLGIIDCLGEDNDTDIIFPRQGIGYIVRNIRLVCIADGKNRQIPVIGNAVSKLLALVKLELFLIKGMDVFSISASTTMG
jgi:hypothetical protein